MALTYAFLLPPAASFVESTYEPVLSTDDDDTAEDLNDERDSVDLDLERPEFARAMSERMQALTQRAVTSKAADKVHLTTADKIDLARPLFVKYMLPLCVFIATPCV